jgi:hypothetical protein
VYLETHGGTTLFRMVGIAHAYEPVAAGFDPEKIKIELEKLGEHLNCDIDMELIWIVHNRYAPINRHLL